MDRGRAGTESGLADEEPVPDANDEPDPGFGELFVLLGVEGLVEDEAESSAWSTFARKAFASGVGKSDMDLPPNFLALA